MAVHMRTILEKGSKFYECENQTIEKAIAKATIKALLDAGYVISVDDGEEITVKRSIGSIKILNAMFTTDEDILHVEMPGTLVESGWVKFIYGNDGYDVISDYTTNLEEMLKPVSELADRIENGDFTIS